MHGSSFKHVVRAKHGVFCLFDCPDSTSTTDTASGATASGGALPTPSDSTTSTTSTTGNGIIPTLPISLSNPFAQPSSTTTSNSVPSSLSTTSTLSTTSSSTTTSSSSSTSSTSTSESSLTTTSSSANNAPTHTPAPSSVTHTSVIVTSSNGEAITITSNIIVVASGTPAADAAGSSPSASPSATVAAVPFLQNKPLAGSVIGIGSAIALVLLVVLLTTGFRKARRSKLERDALTEQLPWPGAVDDDDNDSAPSEGKHAPMDNYQPARGPAPVVVYPAGPGYGAPAPQAYNPYQQQAMPNGYYGQQQQQQWAAGPGYGGYAPQVPQAAYGQPEQQRTSHYSTQGGLAYDGAQVSSPVVPEKNTSHSAY